MLALVFATQTATTRGCSTSPSSPPPTGSDAFTTRDGARFRVDTVITGLDGVPWAMQFAPDGRLFVTERVGRVLIVNTTSRTSEIAFSLANVFAEGEAGLLGLALDPQFAQNHHVYLYHSVRVGSTAVNRIVRYREVSNRLIEAVILLDSIPAAPIHDGGRLKFGPDGLLYATTGDAANQGLSQDVASLAGKILRIDRDGTTATVGNRFNSPVYTYGHRNPQGIDWNPVSGALWSSEHGNVGNDEINAIQSGLDFGWPRIQGAETVPGMEAPATFYSPAIAPSGATFYRGSRIPQFTNNLFVATLRGMHLLRLAIDDSARRITAQERLLDGTYGRLRDVVMGPDGDLYVCTNNRDGRGTPSASDDRILRITPAS